MFASGVLRSLRPLPRHRTWAPCPASPGPGRSMTSETSNPVCAASKQSVITPSQPCAAIRTRQDRFNLRPGEKLKLSRVASLARDREHALNLGAMGRLLERRISEERPNGREAEVPGPH